MSHLQVMWVAENNLMTVIFSRVTRLPFIGSTPICNFDRCFGIVYLIHVIPLRSLLTFLPQLPQFMAASTEQTAWSKAGMANDVRSLRQILTCTFAIPLV